MDKHYFSRLAVLSLLLLSSTTSAMSIVAKGLFKHGAVLEIDGVQRVLKAGKRSPEGVLLVSANSREAVLEIDGKRRKIGLSQQIAAQFSKAEKTEVRVQQGGNGHYTIPGRINGRPVDFLVDTGASAISMDMDTAKGMGINIKNAKRIRLSTANGVTGGYVVTLNKVSVGTITLANIKATVSEGKLSGKILLGNSFLSLVDMKSENGVLVLKSKF